MLYPSNQLPLGETTSALRMAPAPRAVYWTMLAVFAVVLAVFTAFPVINHATGNHKDYPLWHATGQQVLHGETIYPRNQVLPFMYPPLAAILLAPLSALGSGPMVILLASINSLAWIASVLLGVYLLTGHSLRQRPLLYIIPALCSAPYAWDTYHLGQSNLLLLAMMLGAFACLRIQRQWGAGALVALAANIKAFPILAAGYFVYRRQWRALCSTVLFSALFFVAVPFAVRGVDQAQEDLTVWTRGMVLKYDADSVGQRWDRAYGTKNQSLVGLSNRLLRHVITDFDGTKFLYANLVDLDFRTTNAIILVTALGLCLFYVSAMPRLAQRTARSNAIEYAMLLLLVLFFSPYTFGYFYVWLLYPVAAMVHLWLEAPRPSRDAWLLPTVLIAVVALATMSLVWRYTAEAYGNHFVACLLLLGALRWQLSKCRRQATTVVATQPARLAA
jgi:hypothetical protein